MWRVCQHLRNPLEMLRLQGIRLGPFANPGSRKVQALEVPAVLLLQHREKPVERRHVSTGKVEFTDAGHRLLI